MGQQVGHQVGQQLEVSHLLKDNPPKSCLQPTKFLLDSLKWDSTCPSGTADGTADYAVVSHQKPPIRRPGASKFGLFQPSKGVLLSVLSHTLTLACGLPTIDLLKNPLHLFWGSTREPILVAVHDMYPNL